MKITILRNCKLIDGELFYDKEETYETERVSFSLVKHYEDESNESETIGLITINSPLTGRQIEIFKRDNLSIKS